MQRAHPDGRSIKVVRKARIFMSNLPLKSFGCLSHRIFQILLKLENYKYKQLICFLLLNVDYIQHIAIFFIKYRNEDYATTNC